MNSKLIAGSYYEKLEKKFLSIGYATQSDFKTFATFDEDKEILKKLIEKNVEKCKSSAKKQNEDWKKPTKLRVQKAKEVKVNSKRFFEKSNVKKELSLPKVPSIQTNPGNLI